MASRTRTTVKRTLTPEQMERLVSTRMADADRRRTPNPRQSIAVSDEDLRSFPSSFVVDEDGFGRAR